MPRRGENIYKRKDGRWEGRYIKSRTLDGKAKYGYIYANSYKQVKTTMKSIAQNTCISANHMISGTYTELLFQWLLSKQNTVKESTFTRYHRIVNVYIIPFLGDKQICEVTNVIVESYTHHLLTNGRLDGMGGLSAKTVSDIQVVVKSSLEYGKDNNYQINCNTKKIALKKKEKEMRVLSINEQNTLISFLREDIDLYKFGILLSLYTGIRIGELCALRWKNICLESKSIKIKKTLQRIPTVGESSKTRIIITEPKSACSVREIPIPECFLPLIIKFQSSPDAYVLTGDKNRYVEPRTMQYHFHQCIKKVGIASANYHSLRHTFATRCVEMGFEIKSLSEILGHSSVNITLNKYVHSSFELKVQNMNMLTF